MTRDEYIKMIEDGTCAQDRYQAVVGKIWAEGIDRIPEHMRDSLVDYIVAGILPGSFLSAVLAGDLFGAIGTADHVNIARLPDYATFLYDCAPVGCFGSYEAVRKWRGLLTEEAAERV